MGSLCLIDRFLWSKKLMLKAFWVLAWHNQRKTILHNTLKSTSFSFYFSNLNGETLYPFWFFLIFLSSIISRPSAEKRPGNSARRSKVGPFWDVGAAWCSWCSWWCWPPRPSWRGGASVAGWARPRPSPFRRPPAPAGRSGCAAPAGRSARRRGRGSWRPPRRRAAGSCPGAPAPPAVCSSAGSLRPHSRAAHLHTQEKKSIGERSNGHR